MNFIKEWDSGAESNMTSQIPIHLVRMEIEYLYISALSNLQCYLYSYV